MPKRNPKVEVWLVDTDSPWRTVKQATATIHRSMVFIEHNGIEHRRVIGVSAFFTKETAEKRRLGLIDRLLSSSNLDWRVRHGLDVAKLESLLHGQHFYVRKHS